VKQKRSHTPRKAKGSLEHKDKAGEREDAPSASKKARSRTPQNGETVAARKRSQTPGDGEQSPKERKLGKSRKVKDSADNQVAAEAAEPLPEEIQQEVVEGKASLFQSSVVVVGSKVGLLSQPDVNMTTGEYLKAGETFTVVARVISDADGRVFLRLADPPAWVSTRSRKDMAKVVLALSGPSGAPLEPPGCSPTRPCASSLDPASTSTCPPVLASAPVSQTVLPAVESAAVPSASVSPLVAPPVALSTREPTLKRPEMSMVQPTQEAVVEEVFRKKVISKGKVGILMEACISSIPTGEYLNSGEVYEVSKRAFATDGRVFLRLAEDQECGGVALHGWVSTRSRKDLDKIVLITADGSDLETRNTKGSTA